MPTIAARLVVVLTAVAAATTSLSGAAHAEGYYPPTELLGDGPTPIPLKNKAMIKETNGGFRYIAGQQDSHLTVTLLDGTLRLEDTGTVEWREIPPSCQRQPAAVGIAATCTVPAGYDDAHPMYVEVWPRLGNDYVDGRTLPAMVKFWVLADAGRDTVYAGSGDDFVNGAQDADRVRGGAGNDWLRTGIGNDRLWGDTGDDRMVAQDGNDTLRGGAGADELRGGNDADTLYGDADTDRVLDCGGGRDNAYFEAGERIRYCETRIPA